MKKRSWCEGMTIGNANKNLNAFFSSLVPVVQDISFYHIRHYVDVQKQLPIPTTWPDCGLKSLGNVTGSFTEGVHATAT